MNTTALCSKSSFLSSSEAFRPVIKSSNGTVESFEEVSLVVGVGTRLKVVRGASIDLICHASGFPTPRVTWVKGNQPLDERSELQGFYIIPFNGTSTRLLIRGSSEAEKDVFFGCTASNAAGTETVFSYVKFLGK